MKYKTFTRRYHQKSEIIAVYYNEFQILQNFFKKDSSWNIITFCSCVKCAVEENMRVAFLHEKPIELCRGKQKGQRKSKSRGEKIWVIFSAMLLGFSSLMQKLICKLNLSVTSMSLPKFIGEELEVKNCLTSHRAKILGGNATKSSSSHHHNNNGFVEEPKRHLTIFSDSYAPNSQVSVRIKKKNSLRVTIYFIVCDKPHYVSKRWDDNLGIS